MTVNCTKKLQINCTHNPKLYNSNKLRGVRKSYLRKNVTLFREENKFWNIHNLSLINIIITISIQEYYEH